MITRGQPITLADLQALGVLATTKTGNVYDFTSFGGKDQVGLPVDLLPVATYGGAGQWPDGVKVTVRLYAYKTIAGKKTYTWIPLLKAFQPLLGSGAFSMTWTWVSVVGPTAPDGYIISIPTTFADGWSFIWQDIGNVQTFTEDGSFSNPAWKLDVTLDQNNAGFPLQNLPCAHGTWLKTLNSIHKDAFAELDIYGGGVSFSDTHKVSGPWCISAAPKCYLNLLGKTAYKNLKFIYNEADSMTGNQLAPEADMFANFIFTVNGANTFNWDRNVVINGRIAIFSPPTGQSLSDWVVTASHPGITISFNPDYEDGRAVPPTGQLSAFFFDFVDVQYTLGTPVVLTCTPLLPGASVLGGVVDCVFTGDLQTLAKTDTTAIHLAGTAAKSIALVNTLTNIVCHPNGGTSSNESHWRAFCNGVFLANTLPTLGLMTYLDQDLPQYNPSPIAPSSRRTNLSDTLPAIAAVDNRGALWPVLRDLDFVPDSVVGRPVTGSKAWQLLGTKYVLTEVVTLSPPPMNFNFDSQDVAAGTPDIRYLSQNPASTLFLRKNAPPDLTTFDVAASGGVWVSLAAVVPGFSATDCTWFAGVYNPTTGNMTSILDTITIQNAALPNGTFFLTQKDDSGNVIPENEFNSYRFSDPATFDPRPIPLYGYCVYSICARRQPVANASGVALAPTIGTEDLEVAIGIMAGFGFDTDGAFQQLVSLTIPAGQSSITQDVFFPVLAGTPLSIQCDEIVTVRAQANFQPMMHSLFFPKTTKLFGSDFNIGYYDGAPWFDQDKASLFFGDTIADPILLPVNSDVYNDLTNFLNTLP